MSVLTEEIKGRIVAELRGRVDPQQFGTWFSFVDFRQVEGERVEVVFPNAYYRDWCVRNFEGALREAIESTMGPTPVEFMLSNTPPPAPAPVRVVLPTATRTSPQDYILNEHYTFENFVVGPQNRLAHAAALAVSENVGRVYNPLFIHGTVGLGKTHLLQAVCHALLERQPDLDICFVSCEGFVNHYIESLKRGQVEAFRRKYRSLDVLLLDDIHFLQRKEGSQEEFFHTFNALHEAHRQIILSSDSPAKDIPTLEERLVSRFKWGMEVRIDTPSFESRVAILRMKAEMRGKSVRDEVLQFIAQHVDTNIRELEGAIVKVIGLASLSNVPIDLDFAKETLKDTIRVHPSSFPVSMNDIQKAVAEFFNLKIADLQSRKRTKSISLPRQIAMYVARTMLTTFSLEEIGAYFGSKHHTTVMYAIERIEQKIETDPHFRALVDRIRAQVRTGG